MGAGEGVEKVAGMAEDTSGGRGGGGDGGGGERGSGGGSACDDGAREGGGGKSGGGDGGGDAKGPEVAKMEVMGRVRAVRPTESETATETEAKGRASGNSDPLPFLSLFSLCFKQDNQPKRPENTGRQR